MADFQPAVAITLQNEGGFFHNPVTGEIVNHGITLTFVQSSGYKPDADEAFIQNLGVAEASAIYRTYFWNRYSTGSIADQSLANKVFDLTVNMGPAALKLLQSAVNACGGQCAADGVLGPISIAQINALDPAQLLAEFKQLAAQRYQQIASNNARLAGDLTGWLSRLNS
ncbi:MAG TPA: glycosyl hydrolase 108 family protein [Bryobacteraceae bacterium]|jgi:lysozyme family protein|nr:glycosyl hydrolase 108 family protein [Bryobacteraceae bacterium]